VAKNGGAELGSAWLWLHGGRVRRQAPASPRLLQRKKNSEELPLEMEEREDIGPSSEVVAGDSVGKHSSVRRITLLPHRAKRQQWQQHRVG
jgi:hypothetical protein